MDQLILTIKLFIILPLGIFLEIKIGKYIIKSALKEMIEENPKLKKLLEQENEKEDK